MKRIYSNFFLAIMAMTVMVLGACSEDADPPVVEAHFQVDENDPYTIHFSTTDQNVSSYEWSFGDGNVSTDESPVHTYEMSGDYSVTVVVKGDGGEASDDIAISIAASVEEMLTGGTESTNGRTWVLSKVETPGVDGAGQVKPHFPLDIMPFPAEVLSQVGLQEEYDNEYTFKYDGSYSIDYKNGKTLVGWLYAMVPGNVDNISNYTEVGIFQAAQTTPQNCTWELHNGDLSVDAANQDMGTGVVTEETITFVDAQYLTFTNGGFLGINDFNTTAIIREISSTRLVVTLFNNSVQDHPDKPSTLFTLSFDAK